VKEVFQNLVALKKTSSTVNKLNVSAPAFVPTFTPAEIPIVDTVLPDEEEEDVPASSFVPSAQEIIDVAMQMPANPDAAPLFQLNLNHNLMNNSDFNQLLTLMNSLAS
jgi:hypothetical protein